MSFVRQVALWGLEHKTYFSCHDVAKHFDCTPVKASAAINQLVHGGRAKVDVFQAPNPNKHKTAPKEITKVRVFEVVPLRRSYMTRVHAVREDGNHEMRFDSLAEAQRQGYAHSCVVDAARKKRLYCGYNWFLERIV